MGTENLTLTISPTLLEALGIREQGPLNYFKLLGIRREQEDNGAIDRAVMERSRALRQWQTSPQYGREAVKLLSAVHRAATILKDSTRRAAYREELERSERGEARTPLDEFTDLVRAALADGQLDIETRGELAKYAQQNGISPVQAQQILKEVGDKMAAARSAERAEAAPAAAAGAWEFRIAEQGEEAFETMLSALERSDNIGDTSYEKLLAEAARYGVSAERAAVLLADFQKNRFRLMVRRVAHGHIVTDAQSRILLPKAAAYGLDQTAAFEIISDYTLSVMTPDDIMASLTMAQTFDQSEIEEIVEHGADTHPPYAVKLKRKMPQWLSLGILVIAAGGALLLLSMFLKTRKPDVGPPVRIVQPTPVPTEAAETPEPEPTKAFDFTNRPDPPSGFLTLAPEKPGDPPKFEILINEVTCAMYLDYIRATLADPPANWEPGGRIPAGAAQLPVTHVTYDQAMAFAKWFAAQKHFDPATVRVPTQAEYMRALRGMTTRDDPSKPNYWERARLGPRPGPTPVRQEQFDKIFIEGIGQVYDLVGNVAEWGYDQRGVNRIVLGGDFTRPENYNHLDPQWRSAQYSAANIGFRLVHVLP
ncbi:formylglycine-generating enzyme family protein [bacterium]|nr:formylglycine-generating enzyme family protein [bacterium]